MATMSKEPTSTYAGCTLTLDELANARYQIETWADKTFSRHDQKMYENIRSLCTFAQGMWFQNKKES